MLGCVEMKWTLGGESRGDGSQGSSLPVTGKSRLVVARLGAVEADNDNDNWM